MPVSYEDVRHYSAGVVDQRQESVAEECPVAIEYNGISHVVMMATPKDLDDFAVGFSLSEGIVDRIADIYDREIVVAENGVSVSLRIANNCFARLKQRKRNLAGRTGCGLCGVDSLAQVRRQLRPLQRRDAIDFALIHRVLPGLSVMQPLFCQTGATHAAFWVTDDGEVAVAREDVGRHNAIDKLIGALAIAGTDFSRGAVLMTSRASFEIVQKAAAAGIGVVAAISAPTALAIQVAEELNVSLVGFMRSEGYTVYTE
ncbi:MAG: formate dehydrogenase accessory sulfurtransferase FdhD [Porticoccaceae bacterium]|nr:formate dehydrogenase accessory sulfurtransferase FdhD [Porticoccaceae bacterium]